MKPVLITPSDFTTSRYLGKTFSLAKAMENLASSSASSAFLRSWSRSAGASGLLNPPGMAAWGWIALPARTSSIWAPIPIQACRGSMVDINDKGFQRLLRKDGGRAETAENHYPANNAKTAKCTQTR